MTEDGVVGPPHPPSPPGEGAVAAIDPGARNPAVETPPIDISVGNRPDPGPGGSRLVVAFAASLAVSVIIHAALIGANLVRLPSLASPQEEAVPVTVVEDPSKEEAQPKTEAAAPAEKPPAPSKPPQTPQTEPPKESSADAKPPPETSPSKEEPRKEEPKMPPPSATQPAPETEAPATAEQKPPPKEGSAGPSGTVAESIDEKSTHDAVATLREQIEKCWSIPAGWSRPHQVTVVLDIRLERSGALAGKPVPVEFSATELGMEAAKSAVAAATKCAPYHLPPDQYDKWQEAQVRLSPH